MSVVFEKLRDDGELVRQEKERFRLGQNQDLGEVDELSAVLPANRLLWGSLTAVQDGPGVGDPTFGFELAGDVSTLESDDGTSLLVYATLDAGAGLLTLGSAGVDVGLFGVAAGGLPYAGAGGTIVGLAIQAAGKFARSSGTFPTWSDATLPNTATSGDMLYASATNTWSLLAKQTNRFLWHDGTAPAWRVDLPHANLPTGSGSWNYGASSALTLQGQLITSASTTGRAGLIVPHGTAPSSPVNGEFWTTTGGGFLQINGATVTLGITLPVGATQGGTGITTWTIGDVPYASATNTLAKLAIGATGAFVRVAAGLPSWSTLTLPATLAAGRVLYTTATDTVGGIAPTANRALVADGSAWAAGFLPFAALPNAAGGGSWDVGSGNVLTIVRDLILSGVVTVSQLLTLTPRTNPAGAINGNIWIDSGSNELKFKAGGAIYRCTAVTP